MKRLCVKVAVDNVPFHADIEYRYELPAELEMFAVPGAVCTVPFGAGNRHKKAFVLEKTEDDGTDELKCVFAFADPASYSCFIGPETVQLVRYLKEKTFCTYFEAFRTVMPTGSLTERTRVTAKKKYVEAVTGEKTDALLQQADTPGADVKLKRRAEVIRYLTGHGKTLLKTTCTDVGVSDSVILRMAKNGYVRVTEELEQGKASVKPVCEPLPEKIELNTEQQRAYNEMHALLGSGKTHLLYGVTGSGKTLVYIKLIDEVLARGKQAILLIPEISLTFQIVRRLYGRYGANLAVLHSQLSDTERCETSRLIALGEKKVVVGTRSAVFAPAKKLGLIIIDEEQEHTYKSDMSPKYKAADVAAFIASRTRSLLILASATPSFETFQRAESGRISKSVLSARFNAQPLPRILVADMHYEMMSGNRTAISGMLKREIADNLKKGEQSILFINRRGYNTVISCVECRHTVTCPYCGIPMTFHKTDDRLVCHYCGHTRPVPEKCDECGCENIRFTGAGTQKIEQELACMFPTARILRMDADTVAGKGERDNILTAVKDGKCDILLGTQMITKGLDFPNVTLVGVLSADMSLYSSDFRAYERTFSVITQVVGRAGRSEKSGRAVIQTYSPSHRVLRFAFAQDYTGFYESEISFRRTMLYPPFCDMCQVVFIASTQQRAFDAADSFLDKLRELTENRKDLPLRAIRPKATSVPMVDGQYRVRVLIKCRDTHAQRALLADMYMNFLKDKANNDVRIGIDMNPAVIY